MSSKRRLAVIAAVGATGLVAAVSVATSSSADAGRQAMRADITEFTTPRSGVVTASGVTGQAHLTRTSSDRSVVAMQVEGLTPGAEYGVHVHFGRCADFLPHYQHDHYSGFDGSQGPITRANEVWLDVTGNAAGRASDTVRTLSVNSDLPLSVVVHQRANPDRTTTTPAPGPRIACGDFAPAGS